MIFEQITHGSATVQLDDVDLELLAEVLNSGLSNLPQIAGPDLLKFELLQAYGASFQAAALACKHMPEEDDKK